MAYQIFRLLFVRTTGTDLQHDLQHGLQHNRKKLKFHRLFELSVQSIIGATDRRAAFEVAIFCLLSVTSVESDLVLLRSSHAKSARFGAGLGTMYQMEFPCAKRMWQLSRLLHAGVNISRARVMRDGVTHHGTETLDRRPANSGRQRLLSNTYRRPASLRALLSTIAAVCAA